MNFPNWTAPSSWLQPVLKTRDFKGISTRDSSTSIKQHTKHNIGLLNILCWRERRAYKQHTKHNLLCYYIFSAEAYITRDKLTGLMSFGRRSGETFVNFAAAAQKENLFRSRTCHTTVVFYRSQNALTHRERAARTRLRHVRVTCSSCTKPFISHIASLARAHPKTSNQTDRWFLQHLRNDLTAAVNFFVVHTRFLYQDIHTLLLKLSALLSYSIRVSSSISYLRQMIDTVKMRHTTHFVW